MKVTLVGIVCLLVGLLIGVFLGGRAMRDMWAGPDYVDRLLDRCFFETSVAVDAKKQGLARFGYGGSSLTSCLTLIDFANGSLNLSQEQQVRLRQQKKMILTNFPELAAPAAGQKPESKP